VIRTARAMDKKSWCGHVRKERAITIPGMRKNLSERFSEHGILLRKGYWGRPGYGDTIQRCVYHHRLDRIIPHCLHLCCALVHKHCAQYHKLHPLNKRWQVIQSECLGAPEPADDPIRILQFCGIVTLIPETTHVR